MLRNIEDFDGNKLIATDGVIGHVKDFYFEDNTWVIRYLVVDTGDWMPGRLVLLSPHALGGHDRDGKVLLVNLSKEKIEGSPSIESHRPVSRQYEEDYFNYYGWPSYWQGGGMWGEVGFPIPIQPMVVLKSTYRHPHHRHDDVHLRSTESVIGHEIHAKDGMIGSVASFMMDDESWAIGEIVVEVGHWYSGKEILIPVSNVDRIDYVESSVYENLTKAEIQDTAEHQVVKVGA